MQSIQTLNDAYRLCLEFSADGQWLATGGMDPKLRLWHAADWTCHRELDAHEKSVNVMALNAANSRLVTGSSDCQVRIWSFPALACLHTLQDRKKTVSALAMAHRHAWFAIGSYGGRVAIWDMDGHPLGAFRASDRNVACVAFAPDDALLAVGGIGGELTLWSVPDGTAAGRLRAHETAVSFCRFLPPSTQALTLGYDGMLKLWDSGSWNVMRSVRLDRERITGFQLHAESHRAAVLTKGRVRIFDVQAWRYTDDVAVDSNVLPSAAFAPDGKTLAVGSANRALRILTLGNASS